MNLPIYKNKMKDLARKTASSAFSVKYPSNHQVGQARKVITDMIEKDVHRYITYTDKYATPNDDVIIQDGARLLNSQLSLFEMEEVKYDR